MKDQKKAEAIAAERMQLLSPLLAEGLDPAKAKEIKTKICEQTGMSERTLRRYLAKYKEEGFSGLKPLGKGRQPYGAIDDIYRFSSGSARMINKVYVRTA